MRTRFPLSVLLCCTLWGCTPEDSGSPTDPLSPSREGRVLILNEGNFRRGNASVSAYDPASGQVSQDVLVPAEGAAPLDVLQSAVALGNSLLFVVNNSNALVLTTGDSLREVRRYVALGSPRYALDLGGGVVLVTDLYARALLRLDLGSGARDTIPFPGEGAELVAVPGGALITSPDRASVYRYDAATVMLSDSLQLPAHANAIARLPDGTFLLAAGAVYGGTDEGVALLLDWERRSVREWMRFTPAGTSLYPRLAVGAWNVFVLQADLWSASLADLGVTEATLVHPARGATLYGLGYDGGRDEVYLGDARGFSGPGRVLRLDAAGATIDSFAVGPLPNGFVF